MTGDRLRLRTGLPYPLGATWDGRGVNIAVYSENAERIELCLFSPDGGRERARAALPEHTDTVWHGYFPDLRPGDLYGLRAYGPYEPKRGHRFNHHKLLIDPYARCLAGDFAWDDAVYGHVAGHPDADLSFDTRDSAPFVPKCRILDSALPPVAGRPRTPWPETVVYEMHLAGFTRLHPGVPPAWRGTCAGLAEDAPIRHLRSLGITAVELLPVHAFLDEHALARRGLRNYWGYNSIAFFAPAPRYLASGRPDEFRAMTDRLHDAGIEVILDVVYNHTGEGGELGPTVCYRGLDNASYYRLDPAAPRRHVDFTGCGNSLDLHRPKVLQLVLDSLRYWTTEMGADGFRLDLATTLGRERDGGFDPGAGFLDAVCQDPVLSRVKMIAEPWDLGEGGYRLGGFPPGWGEWNDQFRDVVRRFWRGEAGMVGVLASRLTGSSDIFAGRGRRQWASVNFVTAHDGFTLRDLVSYERKHNLANGEDNRDGSDGNHSSNGGVEGPTDDAAVNALRLRRMRSLLVTLLLAQGTPMLLAGDEIGRTQRGNNNAYCQDNELGWIDWAAIDGEAQGLTACVQGLIALRRAHPVFRRARFFRGVPAAGDAAKDIVWLATGGGEKTLEDWHAPDLRSLGFVINGAAFSERAGVEDAPPHDVSFLVLMNAGAAAVSYRLPEFRGDEAWVRLIDTAVDAAPAEDGRFDPDTHYAVAPGAVALFQRALLPRPPAER